MTQTDTAPLKEYLATAVAVVIEDKESRRVAPPLASMEEIMRRTNADIKTALNEMVTSGLLSFHRTVNSVSFEFTPPKKTTIKQQQT